MVLLLQWDVHDGLPVTPAEVDSIIVQVRLGLPVDRAMVLEAYKARFEHFKTEMIRAGRFEIDVFTQWANDNEVLHHELGRT